MHRDEAAHEDILDNSLIIYWKQRWEWTFIYKGLETHEFRILRGYWGAAVYFSFILLVILFLCFFFLFSRGQLLNQNTYFLKRLCFWTVTKMHDPSKPVGFKPKTKLWFKVLQRAWSKVPQRAPSKASVSSRAMFRRMSHSTCRKGRRSQTDFPEYWPLTRHGHDGALREGKDKKGQWYCYFVIRCDNDTVAELRGSLLHGCSGPFCQCLCKKRWACWSLSWGGYTETGHIGSRAQTSPVTAQTVPAPPAPQDPPITSQPLLSLLRLKK